jgi:hypothetical protein
MSIRLIFLPALLVLLLPAAASAETVCIARQDAGFAPKAPEAERPAPVGSLNMRSCHAVVERFTDRTRIWLSGDAGFQGEVEVKNDDLLQVLLDDVELKDEADGEVWGQILSGAGVSVEGQAGGGMLRVKLVEGRLDLAFVVSEDDVYYGESWPQPDPDDAADGEWPEATLPLPPTPTDLRSGNGRTKRAHVGKPLFEVDDILLDPALGQLRYAREELEHESMVTVVSSTVWIKGTTSKVDWREDQAGGWTPNKGAPASAALPTGSRQVGDNAARISREAKGDPFGELKPYTRLTVVSEEKGWLNVTAPWSGGRVQGWIEKKRLFKEGKEQPATPVVPLISSIALGHTIVRWVDDTGHVAPAELPEDWPKDYEPHDMILTLDPLRVAVFDARDELRLLWAEVLKKAPTAAGDAAIRVMVNPAGEVVEAGLPKSSMPDEGINKRLVELAQSAVFEERKVPRKKRRSDPDLNWDVELWLQLSFSAKAQ